MKNLILSKVIRASACLFLSFFYSISMQSQSGWVLQQSGTTQQLRSIYFIDENTGFAVGGRFLMTTNSGTNWIEQQVPPPGAIYTDISFPTPSIGYVVGQNVLVKTTNRGLNWTTQTAIYTDANSVYFTDSSTGYVISNLYPHGSVFKTDNGGLNWYQMFNDTCHLYSLKFTNQYTGYAGGYTTTHTIPVLYKTTDAGYNWSSRVFSQDYSAIRSIYFIGSLYGLLSGSNVIFKTTDGGMNWLTQNQSLFWINNSMAFPIYDTGFTCGWTGNAIGCVLKTKNGGQNWSFQQIPTVHILNYVYFNTTSFGFAVGDSGTILKTTTGGDPIGIKPISSEIPKTFSLSQNYPNPFNPKTIINFQLPMFSNVKLIVYDILGREIAILVNRQLQPGTYEVEWDGSDYPSGIYFYHLQAGNFVETKKMVLIK